MSKPRAFTLIEIILVVVIVSLLAAIVLPRVIGVGEKGRIAAAKAQVSSFESALGRFDSDCGRLPTTSEGLRALVEKPTGLADTVQWVRYLDKHVIPKDPWGKEYVYRYPGTVNTDGFDLLSAGPDGREGTDDDIGNTQR